MTEWIGSPSGRSKSASGHSSWVKTSFGAGMVVMLDDPGCVKGVEGGIREKYEDWVETELKGRIIASWTMSSMLSTMARFSAGASGGRVDV